MFQVNDMVLYGTNGVCRVVDIDERDCGGRMVEYYILKPIYASNSTVFVPVNNEKLTSKMRYVLTEAEKMICDEFSYVLGIPKEEVPSYITNSMKESIH